MSESEAAARSIVSSASDTEPSASAMTADAVRPTAAASSPTSPTVAGGGSWRRTIPIRFVDIPVAYSENLETVIPLIRSVVHDLDQEPAWQDKLLDEPQVMGVESMTGTVVTIRIVAKTATEQQYGVSREIRERVKAAFDEHGVKGPVIPPYGPGPGTAGPR